MKRPLRYRTMGAVREGRGNPSPYSIARKNGLLVQTGKIIFLERFFLGLL